MSLRRPRQNKSGCVYLSRYIVYKCSLLKWREQKQGHCVKDYSLATIKLLENSLHADTWGLKSGVPEERTPLSPRPVWVWFSSIPMRREPGVPPVPGPASADRRQDFGNTLPWVPSFTTRQLMASVVTVFLPICLRSRLGWLAKEWSVVNLDRCQLQARGKWSVWQNKHTAVFRLKEKFPLLLDRRPLDTFSSQQQAED